MISSILNQDSIANKVGLEDIFNLVKEKAYDLEWVNLFLKIWMSQKCETQFLVTKVWMPFFRHFLESDSTTYAEKIFPKLLK